MSKPTPPYKLFIGCPSYGAPNPLFSMDSLAALTYHIGRRYPEIGEVLIQRDVRTYRQSARQGIVDAALEHNCTHLLMLDDDHVFGSDAWDKVWTSVRDGEDVRVCSALYFTRGLPCVPCIWSLTAQGTVPIWYYDPDTLMQVEVVGFGFVLFEMDLFRELNPPFFNLGLGFGEDAAWCARLLHAGVKIWCHTGAKIGHILETPHVITEDDYLRNRDYAYQSSRLGVPQLCQVGGPSREELVARSKVDARPWWRPAFIHQWNLGRRFARFWTGTDSPAKGESVDQPEVAAGGGDVSANGATADAAEQPGEAAGAGVGRGL